MEENIKNDSYLLLDILSPTRRLVNNAKISGVSIPTELGYVKILPFHAPLITKLYLGNIDVFYLEGIKQEEHFFVVRGYCYVVNNKVVILGEIIEKPQEIDKKRAEAALQRAHERLLSFKEDINVARALSAFSRAEARINFVNHYYSDKSS